MSPESLETLRRVLSPKKTVTYRFATVATGGAAQIEFGKTTFYDRTWEKHLDEVIKGGGEFVAVLMIGGFYELSVREPIEA